MIASIVGGNRPQTKLVGLERPRGRRGFTLVESLMAISLAAIASSAMFYGLSSSLQITDATVEETVALGLAEQCIDEVLGARYHAVGDSPDQWPLGRSSVESAKGTRELFDDTDDYDSAGANPPEDRWGVALGQDDGTGSKRHINFTIPAGYLTDWQRDVDVFYVDESDPSVRLSGSSTSMLRAVEVKVYRTLANGAERELATVRRVFGYVPTP